MIRRRKPSSVDVADGEFGHAVGRDVAAGQHGVPLEQDQTRPRQRPKA